MQLYMLEEYGRETGTYPDIIIRDVDYEWVKELLELVEYPGEIIEWDGGVIEVKKLVIPSATEPTIEESKWLKDRMTENSDAGIDASNKIFVSRQDSDVRKIENFEEVKRKLKEEGFDIITPGENTVEEQVKIFEDAEIIIGPHGAGIN